MSDQQVHPDSLLKIEFFHDFMAAKLQELGTQSRLAQKVGVSQGAIHKFLVQKTRPTLEMIEKVCRAFDVPPSSFLDMPEKEGCLKLTPLAPGDVVATGVRRDTSGLQFLGYYEDRKSYQVVGYDNNRQEWVQYKDGVPCPPPNLVWKLPFKK